MRQLRKEKVLSAKRTDLPGTTRTTNGQTSYGNDRFLGLDDIEYKLNCTEDELVEMAEQNGVTLQRQRKIWNQNVKMVNFRFWQNFADCERDPETVAAHKAIYEGKVAYAAGEISDTDENGETVPSKAEKLFEKGINGMKKVLEKYPQLAVHTAYIEEGMLAVYYWDKIHQYNGKKTPQQHAFTDMMQEYQYLYPDVEREFLLENLKGLNY